MSADGERRPLALRTDSNTVDALVRGQRYAEVLFDADRPPVDDPPILVGLDRVTPAFFARIERERPELQTNATYDEFKRERDVICVRSLDELPDEFSILWTAREGEGGSP